MKTKFIEIFAYFIKEKYIMKKFIFTTLFLGAYVYCERANLNKIDMDPRIMNWSYVGPIKSVEVHDEMLQQILLNGIGNDSVFVFDGKSYPIIDACLLYTSPSPRD